MRPKAHDLVEGEVGAGGDHKVIIGDGTPVFEQDAAFRRDHLFCAHGDQVDAAPGKDRGEIHLDVLAFAPAHRHPGVGGYEMIGGAAVDHCELIFPAELVPDLVCGDHSAKACAENNDVRHLCHPSARPTLRAGALVGGGAKRAVRRRAPRPIGNARRA